MVLYSIWRTEGLLDQPGYTGSGKPWHYVVYSGAPKDVILDGLRKATGKADAWPSSAALAPSSPLTWQGPAADGEDEEGTLAALTAHLKELSEPCIVVRRAVAFQESMPCDSRTASAQTRIIEAFSNRHEGSPRIVRREANARERHNLFHGLLWILVMPALSGSRKNQRRPLPPFAQHVDEKIAKRKHMRGSVLFIGNCQNPKHEVHLLSTQPR